MLLHTDKAEWLWLCGTGATVTWMQSFDSGVTRCAMIAIRVCRSSTLPLVAVSTVGQHASESYTPMCLDEQMKQSITTRVWLTTPTCLLQLGYTMLSLDVLCQLPARSFGVLPPSCPACCTDMLTILLSCGYEPVCGLVYS